jgi:hypothetical protein
VECQPSTYAKGTLLLAAQFGCFGNQLGGSLGNPEAELAVHVSQHSESASTLALADATSSLNAGSPAKAEFLHLQPTRFKLWLLAVRFCSEGMIAGCFPLAA